MDDAPTDPIAAELAASAAAQNRARMANDPNALAVASRRRWRALIAADPQVARRGCALLNRNGDLVVEVASYDYRRTGT